MAEDSVRGASQRPIKPSTARGADETLAELDEALAERDEALAERDETLAERDETLAELDETLAERDEALAELDETLAELDEALIHLRLPPLPVALPVSTTDAHTHIGSTTEYSQLSLEHILAAARSVNVTRLVEVGTDAGSSREAIAMADAHPEVVAAVAIHPNDAARLGAQLPAELAVLEQLVGSSPRVRGIGETGLDYFRTTDAAGQARQKEAFAAHIAWAKAHDLALVIHDRDAHADILDMLAAEGAPERVQMHCFSGDAAFARACLDRGFWLSFPGTVTFKPNEALREALDITPLDKLLVETDAPYLTPLPYRGKPNSSYLLPHTVRFIAERRGVDLAELCVQLATNASAVFGDWGDDEV
ncbi:MAG TPA: YchF/TatD family DNA exonuclease [Propionicimonas sp.]|nr:YchF/TatD family DNA exonuclease [Propionicimonas sp.]